MCFDIIEVIKGSHLVKSKVAFLKSTKNAAGFRPFFLRWNRIEKTKMSNFMGIRLDYRNFFTNDQKMALC